MNTSPETYRSDQLLLILFSVFVAGCTFSIALAQIALGLSLLTFLYQHATGRRLTITSQSKPIFIILALFVFWQIITSVAASGFNNGLADVQNLALFLALPIGLQATRTKKNLRLLLHVLALFILIGAIAGIIQFFSGVEWPGVSAPKANVFFGFRAQGLFSSPMTFAHVFVMPVVLFFSLAVNQLKKRSELISSKLCLITGSLGSIAILLAFSRGALIGLIAGIIWIALQLKNRAIIYVLITLIFLAGLSSVLLPDLNKRFAGLFDIDLNSQMYTGRLHVWQKSIEVIADSPIIGVGRTNFKAEYINHMDQEAPLNRLPGDAHNDWLSIMSIAGLPGGLLLLALWLVVIREIKSVNLYNQPHYPLASASLAAIVSILVMGLFASLFEDAEVIHLIMLTWMFGLVSSQTDRKSETI